MPLPLERLAPRVVVGTAALDQRLQFRAGRAAEIPVGDEATVTAGDPHQRAVPGDRPAGGQPAAERGPHLTVIGGEQFRSEHGHTPLWQAASSRFIRLFVDLIETIVCQDGSSASMAGSYQTVLVGTDGSVTSFRAVDRAAGLAAAAGARLLIVSAYQPAEEGALARERDILGPESYQLVGSAPAEDNLGRAADRARRAGLAGIET